MPGRTYQAVSSSVPPRVRDVVVFIGSLSARDPVEPQTALCRTAARPLVLLWALRNLLCLSKRGTFHLSLGNHIPSLQLVKMNLPHTESPS